MLEQGIEYLSPVADHTTTGAAMRNRILVVAALLATTGAADAQVIKRPNWPGLVLPPKQRPPFPLVLVPPTLHPLYPLGSVGVGGGGSGPLPGVPSFSHPSSPSAWIYSPNAYAGLYMMNPYMAFPANLYVPTMTNPYMPNIMNPYMPSSPVMYNP